MLQAKTSPQNTTVGARNPPETGVCFITLRDSKGFVFQGDNDPQRTTHSSNSNSILYLLLIVNHLCNLKMWFAAVA